MPIPMHCTCGKMLQIDEQHLGKKAKCPTCGSISMVSDIAAESDLDMNDVMLPDAPATRPGVADDDGTELQEVRKPFRRPRDTRRSALPWYALGGCAFVVLLCCVLGVALGAWLYHRNVTDRERQRDQREPEPMRFDP